MQYAAAAAARSGASSHMDSPGGVSLLVRRPVRGFLHGISYVSNPVGSIRSSGTQPRAVYPASPAAASSSSGVATGRRGRTTWKVLPLPSPSLSTQIRPPCCSTMPWQMVSPMPRPP